MFIAKIQATLALDLSPIKSNFCQAFLVYYHQNIIFNFHQEQATLFAKVITSPISTNVQHQTVVAFILTRLGADLLFSCYWACKKTAAAVDCPASSSLKSLSIKNSKKMTCYYEIFGQLGKTVYLAWRCKNDEEMAGRSLHCVRCNHEKLAAQ